MIESLYLNSKGICCRLESTSETLGKIMSDGFTMHYIPDLEIYNNSPGNPDIEISGCRIDRGAKIDYPHAEFREGMGPRDIVSLCEYLLERARQEKLGIYCLNSATASIGNRAITFFAGATNSGKTSSMLELVAGGRFKFFSDEHTLIDLSNKKIVGGSRSIASRKGVLKKRLNTSEEFYTLDYDIDEKDADLFVYPHIDNGLDNPIIYKFSNLDFYWTLSREFGNVIRGSAKFVEDFTFPLPSIDTQDLSERRVKKTKSLTESRPCYYFQGSPNQMVGFIENFFIQND